MTEKTELLARTHRAFAERDVETVVAMVDPSITIWQTDELPWGGHYEGLDGFADFCGKLTGTITSSVEVEDIYEAGDHVVQIGFTRGTVNATGVPFDVRDGARLGDPGRQGGFVPRQHRHAGDACRA